MSPERNRGRGRSEVKTHKVTGTASLGPGGVKDDGEALFSFSELIDALKSTHFLVCSPCIFVRLKSSEVTGEFADFAAGFTRLKDTDLTADEFDQMCEFADQALNRVRLFYVQPGVSDDVRANLQRILEVMLNNLVDLRPSDHHGIGGQLCSYGGGFRILQDDLDDEQSLAQEAEEGGRATVEEEPDEGTPKEVRGWVAKQAQRILGFFKK